MLFIKKILFIYNYNIFILINIIMNKLIILYIIILIILIIIFYYVDKYIKLIFYTLNIVTDNYIENFINNESLFS